MSPPIRRFVAKSLKETTTRRSEFPYNFTPPPLTSGQRIEAWFVRMFSLACGLVAGYSFGGLYPNKYLEDSWQYELKNYHTYDDQQQQKKIP